MNDTGRVIEPVPAPTTIIRGGLMVFEAIVTAAFEQRSMPPPRDLHIRNARRQAGQRGYTFAGEGIVERLATSDERCWLYRLTVPVGRAAS